ncbi:hypothetical protein ABIB73_005745 [Bradyrhizobium sp. F1.4.3]|uniref:hypothetical protein n=1 Tax=Bradyrhizobium sp. F1.4.3 TaxID=3156356 RepID=UPI003398D433
MQQRIARRPWIPAPRRNADALQLVLDTTPKALLSPSRHCERSEAIQNRSVVTVCIASLRNDER